MNSEEIREIVEIFNSAKLSLLNIENEEFKITLEKEGNFSNVNNLINENVMYESGIEVKNDVIVTAPIVGMVTICDTIEIGKRVKKGEKLLVIEAMKVLNEIESPADGIIKSINIYNGEFIEFDQELLRIQDND
ncbi:acetyl-CoA carboxylase biotin carboxyl carrier protein [Paraclostridium bifermentans]|uniref:acetyl-CoA carboxylase biotin carboxyl carrier protein n=1 Tax=Paraclostridium bifermentans TaxID=1490 RepID=UPI002907E2D7|nr:biotin/lipoyl-containing protein [Paraclostridium bifermentans]MDU3338019.1 biotin/lipoyl-containing protein [Paraclostridium bifermentans]